MEPNTSPQPEQTPPTSEPATTVTSQPAPVAPETSSPSGQPALPIAASGSKKLAIWSLVLAIVSFFIAFLYFISAPLAIVAVILGIVSLSKHKPGKGLSIAGVSVGAVTLVLVIPFWVVVSIVAYNGIQEKAKEAAQQKQQSSSQQSIREDTQDGLQN